MTLRCPRACAPSRNTSSTARSARPSTTVRDERRTLLNHSLAGRARPAAAAVRVSGRLTAAPCRLCNRGYGCSDYQPPPFSAPVVVCDGVASPSHTYRRCDRDRPGRDDSLHRPLGPLPVRVPREPAPARPAARPAQAARPAPVAPEPPAAVAAAAEPSAQARSAHTAAASGQRRCGSDGEAFSRATTGT